MILIPRIKHWNIQMPPKKVGISGEFRLVLMDINGRVLRDTGWKKNLITDVGLNHYGGQSTYGFPVNQTGMIGSDATAVDVTDTAMGALLAYTAGVGTVNSAISGPNYERFSTWQYRFNAGVGTGTIREVGIGPHINGTELTCHQNVSPAVTKAADQVLDLYYRVTLYPDTGDDTGTVVLDGITYDTTTRASRIDNTGSENYRCAGVVAHGSTLSGYNAAYDGAIGAITSYPAGSSNSDLRTHSTLAYSPNSKYRDMQYFVDLDGFNLGAGIRCATFHGWPCGMQTSFSAQGSGNTIPKNNTKVLTLGWRVTWDRH